jgi:hypothetical protein
MHALLLGELNQTTKSDIIRNIVVASNEKRFENHRQQISIHNDKNKQRIYEVAWKPLVHALKNKKQNPNTIVCTNPKNKPPTSIKSAQVTQVVSRFNILYTSHS